MLLADVQRELKVSITASNRPHWPGPALTCKRAAVTLSV